MKGKVLALNAEVSQLSGDLIANADESWSEIQLQTAKIIHDATQRVPFMVETSPNGDREHWLHDLRSPGASMLSAVTLLLDEAVYTPSNLNVEAVQNLQGKIVLLRAAIDDMAGEPKDTDDSHP
jgi:hypothetical protein